MQAFKLLLRAVPLAALAALEAASARGRCELKSPCCSSYFKRRGVRARRGAAPRVARVSAACGQGASSVRRAGCADFSATLPQR